MLKLPRHYHPDFRLPNKKPIDQVKLNPENKLARHLICSYLGGNYAAWSDSSASNYNIQVINGEKANVFGTVAEDAVVWPSDFDLFRRQTFTYLVRFSFDITGTPRAAIFNADSRFNIAVRREGISNLGVNWYDGTAFREFTFGIPTSLQPYTMVVSRQEGVHTTAYLYNEGTKTVFTDTTNLANIQYVTTRDASFGASDQVNERQVSGHDLMLFDVSLDEGQIDQLVADRYQMFEPSQPTIYFPSAVTPPTLDGNVVYTGTDAFDIPDDSILLFDNTAIHTGANNASVLTDAGQTWVTNEWVDLIVRNDTDLSLATVTANTATTITGTLAGGTDNDWDTNDLAALTAALANGDTIHWDTLSGDVSVNDLGVPTISGPAGTYIFQWQIQSGASFSEIYTATITTTAAAVLSGTMNSSTDEDDVTGGGRTSIITAVNDTWVAAGATFNAQRQAIIDGFDAASSPTNGWNNEVRDNAAVTSVVRTSDTIVTVTWAAQAGYDIAAQEIVTCTVPNAALVTSTGDLTAAPTFTIDPVVVTVSAVITGTTVPSATEVEMVTGSETTILTLTNDTFVTAGATFDAQRQAIIDGVTAAATPTNGWNNEVRDNAAVTSVVRTSSTVVTITWAAQAGYDIASNETITVTIPASALVTSVSAVVASPTFTISAEGTGINAGILHNPLRSIIRNPLCNILRRASAIVISLDNIVNGGDNVVNGGDNVVN